jgi:CIC family chloride channel protein
MQLPRRLRLLHRAALRLGMQADWYMVALGAAIGAVTAFGAIGFAELLHAAERFAGELHQTSRIVALVALPMAGALATGMLVYFFAREARGHGVPEVMDALFRRGGRIRPRVALVKSLASACTIGSGGSAGAEGPIVQIGAAIGSGVAQVLRVSRDQAGTLLGCGAAAGIASIFNAPIAGVFFVLEILLRDFSLRTFTPIVVSSVFSAAVTQAVLGRNVAIFAANESLRQYEFTLPELPSYILLGIFCGFIASGFIKLLYATEDFAESVRIHPIAKPVIGAALLGGLGLLYVVLTSGGPAAPPPFYGNGYDVIRFLLEPGSYGLGESIGANVPLAGVLEAEAVIMSPTLLVLLGILVGKLLATCFTLGSGGSGGVFAPSLFLGAVGGGLFGVALQHLGLLPAAGSPATYALVGMAAVVAGTTHAPLTAILIIFEITRDIYVLLPIMLAAVMATGVARLVFRDSIYTLKLRRRGVLLGSSADLTILRRIPAREVPLVPHVAVRPEDPVSKLLDLNREYLVADFVVVDDNGNYEGIITSQDLRTALLEREAIPLLLVEDLVVRTLPTISPDEGLHSVLDKFSRHDVASLAMVEVGANGEPRILGLLTRGRLMGRYQQALLET